MHHEPMMMSGARAMISSAVTMRSLADLLLRTIGKDVDAAGDLDQLRHPGDAGDHRLVPFLEINLRPARQSRARCSRTPAMRGRQIVGQIARRDPCAPTSAPSSADHVENLGNGALVEGVNVDALPDQRRDDVGLQVGEGQDEVGLQRRGSWGCRPT